MSRDIIRLIRPHQWLKNAFVFTPLFFSRHATEWCYVAPTVLAFLAFCLAASGVYCFNDIHDAEADRLHPVKRRRPVASGAIGKPAAYATMGLAWLIAFALTATAGLFGDNRQEGLACTLLLYIVMNIAYCVKLKQTALLDVFMIATGFVMRIVAGGLVTGIALSHWIVLTTFLLALFLALAKRRDDVAVFEASGVKSRANVDRYNTSFLAAAIAVLGSITVVCYILYTVSADVQQRMGSHYLYVTSVFVLAGILRYMQLTMVDHRSGSPTNVLIHDRFIHVCIVGWIAVFTFILYA
jgi:4-hydroxybenzoate polyprenyltransferase